MRTMKKPYWTRAPCRWARDTYPSVPWRPGMCTGRIALSPWLYASGKTPDGRTDPLYAYILDGVLPTRADDRARFRNITGLAAHKGYEGAKEAGQALLAALDKHERSQRLPSPTAHGGFGLWVRP